MCIQMAQSERRQEKQLHLGGVHARAGTSRDSPPGNHRVEATAQGFCMTNLHDAQASTTEEPDAGKLHVRVCAGGAG